MAITIEQLHSAYAKGKKTHGGKKEDYFPALYLSEKFDRPLESVFSNCSFGKNSVGIDAYYIDRETRNLYLYQFRWSDNYELFKEGYKGLIRSGMEQVFSEIAPGLIADPMLQQLKTELQEYQSLIDKVYICFVFNGDPEKAESSRVLESLREELESKKHLVDGFFERSQIALTIQYISNATKKINQTSRTRKTFQYEIEFKAQSEKLAAGGEEMYLGFIRLHDLYLMYRDMNQRLFEKNIRAGLSDERSSNQAIKRSIKEIVIDRKLSPEYFTFHHNGITLHAEKIEFENGVARIVEPRVLNGAQTITTLAKFIEQNENNETFQENMDVLRSIEVIGKVVTRSSNEFITQITISNNKQNPVESWNLRANDLIQLEFDDKFRAAGIFYERQENSFDGLTHEDLEELGIQHDRDIKIRKLAQTFLAFQGEIDKISDIRKVFEMDSLYEKTFRPDFLRSDTRKILLAYKVQLRLGAIIKEIESKGETKYSFVRFAKNLVWALTIQSLLNEEDLEGLLENYGTSFTMEANFSELLKNLASRRVRVLLSDLITQERYAQWMVEGKFHFLKTKQAFQECMALANKRWGWEQGELKKQAQRMGVAA